MSKLYKQQKRTDSAPAASPSETAAPVMIGNQSMEALMRGTAVPSAENLGHRVDLPEVIRTKMENAFGADFGGVQLYESQAVADAGANAVTMGGRIAFAPGKLDFVSQGGQALLGHELSHVVSQARGEVSGAGFLNHHALEARADREGALAAAGESAYTGPVTPLSASSVTNAAGPMQASKKEKKAAEQMERERLDNAQRDEAVAKFKQIITDSDEYNEEHGRLEEELQGIEERKAEGDTQFIALDGIHMINYEEAKKERNDAINALYEIDLNGLDGKRMNKNATHMERLAGDFKGVNLMGVTASSALPTASMDAHSITHKIRVNNVHHKTGEAENNHTFKRQKGKYVFRSANENYAGAHEMGHMVNYHLKDKLNKTAHAQGNYTHDQDYDDISKLVIAESLAKQARKNPELHAILAEQLKLTKEQQSGLFTGDPATIRQIAKGLDTPELRDEIGKDVVTDYETGKWLREESPLLKQLHEGGYTSGYGSSQAIEMYAEAFGDYYRYQHKHDKYSKEDPEKLKNLEAERNPLTDEIVLRSKKLFADEKKRKKFIKKYYV